MLTSKLKTAAIGLLGALALTSAAGLPAQVRPADEAAQAGRDDGPKASGPTRRDADGVRVVSEVRDDAEVLFVVRDGARVRQGDLICSLDPSDLDRRKADQIIAVNRARAAYQNAKLTREVAELALAEYGQVHKQEVEKLKGDIAVTQARRKRAEEKLEWSERMLQKGYVSRGQNATDRINHKRAVLDNEQAQEKARILDKFTHPKMVKELQADLDRARADEDARDRTWDLEQKALAALEEQIKNCRIYAPVSGRLVYARWRPPGTNGPFAKLEVGATVRWRQLLFRIVPGKPPADEAKSPAARR